MHHFSWPSSKGSCWNCQTSTPPHFTFMETEVWESCPRGLAAAAERQNGDFSKSVFTPKPRHLHSIFWLQTPMMIFLSKHILIFSIEKDNSDSWKMSCTELFNYYFCHYLYLPQESWLLYRALCLILFLSKRSSFYSLK